MCIAQVSSISVLDEQVASKSSVERFACAGADVASQALRFHMACLLSSHKLQLPPFHHTRRLLIESQHLDSSCETA
jgi:hypothetical protein